MTRPSPAGDARPVRRASVADTVRTVLTVLAPSVATGLIARRPRAMALAERLATDRRSVQWLRRLRARYGPGPLRLTVPGRSVVILLSAGDVQRVLGAAPEPFTPATWEKRAALAHFQPHGLLISPASARRERRRFTEAVLDTDHPTHGLAPALVPVMREEARSVAVIAAAAGQLTWQEFAPAWWRTVRRITLGAGARDDQTLIDMLAALRQGANWSFLRPPRAEPRERFLRRLGAHLARAEPNSLAGRIASTPASDQVRPEHQVAHWLFAFDAAGLTLFRTLALLATHPDEVARVHREIDPLDLSAPQRLSRLRADVLETLRLWPTTPVLLRDTTTVTHWGDDTTLPAGTAVVVYAPLLHRDVAAMPWADHFTPEIWLREDSASPTRSLLPFSTGPAGCPGRDLVLLTTTTVLAALLEQHVYRLTAPPSHLGPHHPLPGTVNPFSLRFAVSERS